MEFIDSAEVTSNDANLATLKRERMCGSRKVRWTIGAGIASALRRAFRRRKPPAPLVLRSPVDESGSKMMDCQPELASLVHAPLLGTFLPRPSDLTQLDAYRGDEVRQLGASPLLAHTLPLEPGSGAAVSFSSDKWLRLWW
jgi:hypothetical protein